jgi:DNA-binding transcriptional MerR regulator
MTDLILPKATTTPQALPHSSEEASERIKIGVVARDFGVSVDLLRLYEREGILIPLKSPKGTRYFTRLDYPWIATVLRLVREARLNFAGIRHLLALLPCREIRSCDGTAKDNCSLKAGANDPCWVHKSCCTPEGDCYLCEVYRSAAKCENLKAFVADGTN